MNSEDKFKKELNDLLSAKEFPFDELEWKKTSAMLDAKERKKRVAYILFTGLLFIIGGTIFLCLPLEAESTASADNTEINDTKIIKEQNTEVTKSDIKINNVAKSETIKSVDSKANSVQPKTLTEKPALESPKKEKSDEPAANDPLVSEPKTSLQEKITSGNPAIAINDNATPEKTNLAHDKIVDDLADKITKNVPAPIPTPDENVAEHNETPPVITASPKLQTEEKTEVQKSTDVTNATEVAEAQLNETQALTIDSAVVVDSILTQAPIAKPDTDYVKKNRPEITIEGGASYLFGWQTSQGRDARGLNGILGINYMRKLASDIKIGIGLHYSAVGHLKYSTYTSKITRLDLGEISQVTVFTPQKIHYVWLPIKLHYAINNKSVFGGGITVGYLLTIDSKVEQFGQTILGQTNYQVSKEKGYTRGFNEIDAQVSVFYQHKLFGRFYGNAEFVYGIRDVKNGEILSSEGFERNLGFKFTLLYKLFDN